MLADVAIPVVFGIPATGTVVLKAGKRTLDTAELVDGAASFAFTPERAGKLRLRVVYGGDPTYTSGASEPRTYTVLRKKRR